MGMARGEEKVWGTEGNCGEEETGIVREWGRGG